MKSRYANRITALRAALVMVAMVAALGSAGCGPTTNSNASRPGQVATSNSASAATVATATPSSVTAATLKLNGTYRWTLTKEDALAHGTAGDKTAEGLVNYPYTITVRLEQNKWLMTETGHRTPVTVHSVAADKIAFSWPRVGSVITVGFSVDSKGNLRLTPVPLMDDGDRFVWTTKVCTKIG